MVKGQDDICKGIICPRGRLCVPHTDSDDGKRYTTCECPTSCPAGVSKPVCSYYNNAFNSRCEMHKYGCAHDLTMRVKNQGSCPADGMITRAVSTRTNCKLCTTSNCALRTTSFPGLFPFFEFGEAKREKVLGTRLPCVLSLFSCHEQDGDSFSLGSRQTSAKCVDNQPSRWSHNNFFFL